MTDSLTQWSYSRVGTFEQCPFRFKLQYIDKVSALSDTDAGNALILGTAMHEGIRFGVEAGIKAYTAAFPVLTDAHVHEIIKLETMIEKARLALANVLGDAAVFEYELNTPEFKGFIDLVTPNGDGTVDIYDFKYSNNIENYLKSSQLSIYKYYWEKLGGLPVRNLYFVFIGKVGAIRQKQTETLFTFRERLNAELAAKTVKIMPVKYDFAGVNDFLATIAEIPKTTDFYKNETKLCGWCDFDLYCRKGLDYMLLPKNARRDIANLTKKTIWIYGEPFSGKTYFANKFPSPLMLNTDGNIKFVDAPFIAIKDEITMNGRIAERKLSWAVFKDAVEELEKKQNDFKTIVVDLIDDIYEFCRLYVYSKNGISHESDSGFGKGWDLVRTEFLSVMRRLLNLEYENIILISHESRAESLTKKSGDKLTIIKPSLNDKVAHKLAGMVDLVGRVVAEGSERVLSLKADEMVFGGGRLTSLNNTEISLNYDAFAAMYQKAAPVSEKAAETKPEPKPQATERQPRVSVKE